MKFFGSVLLIGLVLAVFGFDPLAGAGILFASVPILANIETSDDAKQKRSEIWDHMNAMVQLRKSEKRDFTSQEKTKYNDLRKSFDELTDRLKELEADEERALQMAGKAFAEKHQRASSSNPSAWVDLETGRPVAVLSKEERMANVDNDRHTARLSLGAALRGLVTGNWRGAEEERSALSTASGSGLLIPSGLFNNVLDLARAKSVVIAGGAPTVVMPEGSMSLARVIGDPEIQEKAENELFSNDNIIFDGLPMKAETLGAVCSISRELATDSPNIGTAIETALAGAIAARLDYLALNGTGSNNQPMGLKNLSGCHEIDMESDVLQFGSLLKAWHLIASANGDPNVIALNPLERAYLSSIFAPGAGWVETPELLRTIQYLQSTAVLHDGDTGLSDAFVGDFRQMAIGLRQGAFVEVTVEGGDAFRRHQVLLKITLRGTVGILRPAHFCRIVGIETPDNWSEIQYNGIMAV